MTSASAKGTGGSSEAGVWSHPASGSDEGVMGSGSRGLGRGRRGLGCAGARARGTSG